MIAVASVDLRVEQFEQYRSTVIETVARGERLAEPSDAEDAFNMVILEHIEHPERLERLRKPILGYLIAYTKRRLRDLWRRLPRDKEIILDISDIYADVVDDEERPMEQFPDPTNIASIMESVESLNQIMKIASPPQQQICMLMLLGHTQEEIAKLLGISRRTVRKQFERLCETCRHFSCFITYIH